MITNDFTSRQTSMMEFYTNQYIQTTNQIQTLMDKQTDLVKLIRELNDYQYLLVSRQTELLRLLNQVSSITNSQPIPEPINQTFTPNILPSANQEPLSETIRNSSIPQSYYPNLNQPLSTPRTIPRNTSRITESLPQLPPTTTSTFDNYLVYTFLPNETSRTTTRTPQTLNSTNLASSFLETFIDEFLNPVSTAPTNEQIQEATTSITYREISNPVNTNCPISLNTFQQEDLVLQINRCRHNYTPSFLLEWFRSNNHCPLCRIDIREVAEDLE
jgi:ribosomal protein S14